MDWGSLPCSGCVWAQLFWVFLVSLPSLCCKKENLLIVTLQDIHAPWWSLTRIPVSSAAPQQSIMMANLMTCYIFKAINAPSQASLSSSTSITVFPQNLSVPHSLTAVHLVFPSKFVSVHFPCVLPWDFGYRKRGTASFFLPFICKTWKMTELLKSLGCIHDEHNKWQRGTSQGRLTSHFKYSEAVNAHSPFQQTSKK